jgi:ribosomal protein L40E
MNYFNLPCPVCGEIFKDGDDIVVCPECATPHHRECWHSNGQCINTSLHGTDFVWKSEKTAAAKPENENPTPFVYETEAETGDVKICHICSSENPADALHCGNCGALFEEEEKEENFKICTQCGAKIHPQSIVCTSCGAYQTPEIKNPFVESMGIDENEEIGGYSAGDYALYTRLNAKRYIPKFRKLEEKKLSFNWAAFFFGPSWFLFRKIHKVGIILLVVFASITMMTAPLQEQLFEATENFYSLSQPLMLNPEMMEAATDEEVIKLLTDYYSAIQMPTLILLGILLVQRLICGFIADKLYYNKIKSDFAIIGEAAANDEIRKIMIAQRGSVSFIAYLAGYFGEQTILNLFVFLADKLSNWI